MIYAECSANIFRAISHFTTQHVTQSWKVRVFCCAHGSFLSALSLSALTLLFPLKEVDMALIFRGKQRGY